MIKPPPSSPRSRISFSASRAAARFVADDTVLLVIALPPVAGDGPEPWSCHGQVAVAGAAPSRRGRRHARAAADPGFTGGGRSCAAGLSCLVSASPLAPHGPHVRKHAKVPSTADWSVPQAWSGGPARSSCLCGTSHPVSLRDSGRANQVPRTPRRRWHDHPVGTPAPRHWSCQRTAQDTCEPYLTAPSMASHGCHLDRLPFSCCRKQQP